MSTSPKDALQAQLKKSLNPLKEDIRKLKTKQGKTEQQVKSTAKALTKLIIDGLKEESEKVFKAVQIKTKEDELELRRMIIRSVCLAVSTGLGFGLATVGASAIGNIVNKLPDKVEDYIKDALKEYLRYDVVAPMLEGIEDIIQDSVEEYLLEPEEESELSEDEEEPKFKKVGGSDTDLYKNIKKAFNLEIQKNIERFLIVDGQNVHFTKEAFDYFGDSGRGLVCDVEVWKGSFQDVMEGLKRKGTHTTASRVGDDRYFVSSHQESYIQCKTIIDLIEKFTPEKNNDAWPKASKDLKKFLDAVAKGGPLPIQEGERHEIRQELKAYFAKLKEFLNIEGNIDLLNRSIYEYNREIIGKYKRDEKEKRELEGMYPIILSSHAQKAPAAQTLQIMSDQLGGRGFTIYEGSDENAKLYLALQAKALRGDQFDFDTFSSLVAQWRSHVTRNPVTRIVEKEGSPQRGNKQPQLVSVMTGEGFAKIINKGDTAKLRKKFIKLMTKFMKEHGLEEPKKGVKKFKKLFSSNPKVYEYYGKDKVLEELFKDPGGFFAKLETENEQREALNRLVLLANVAGYTKYQNAYARVPYFLNDDKHISDKVQHIMQVEVEYCKKIKDTRILEKEQEKEQEKIEKVQKPKKREKKEEREESETRAKSSVKPSKNKQPKPRETEPEDGWELIEHADAEGQVEPSGVQDQVKPSGVKGQAKPSSGENIKKGMESELEKERVKLVKKDKSSQKKQSQSRGSK